MYVFANQPAVERQIAFEQTANQMGLPAHLIEKDFWVCVSLKILFSLPGHAQNLTFKGGTSLSKVFNVIDRFSEDIDFAISRESLGFTGDEAPDASEISGKERKRRLESLGEACQTMVETKLFPAFEQRLRDVLIDKNWKIEFKPDEKSNQVIYFQYPKTALTVEQSYNPPMVRVELTGRTDNHPCDIALVKPHVAEQLPSLFDEPTVNVKVLAVERTYWEKATILHQLHYCENADQVPQSHSRHYYDMYRLDLKGISKSAIDQIKLLLPEVADHKKLFYRQGWARYDLAREPQTLQLIPNKNIITAIEKDYNNMREMIFGEAPSFTELIEHLEQLQARINSF